MPTVINTNLASLFAQNSLSNAQNNLAQSVQRLSSGLRINSAKDDAAGLSISQNMQSQINGTNQSIRNLSDATNLLQVADSSLSTVQDMLLRLKQLATQGYDGSLSTSQKLNIVQEMKDLNNEINATAARTAFNGIKLLSSGSSVDLNNSDIKTGTAITTTAPSITQNSTTYGLGYYATGGTGAATGLNDVSTGLLLGVGSSAGGTTATTYSLTLDPAMAPKIAGNFTLSSNGSALTLTGTLNGLAASQTVTVQDALSNATGGTAKTTQQTLDFSNFGIKLNLSSTRAAGDTLTGSTIATKLATSAYRDLQVNGVNGEITDVRLSGVAPGTYSLVYNETGGVGSLGLPSNASSVLITAGGTAGTVRGVALTGGSGTGAYADIAYDSTGAVTGVTMRVAGSGYKAGDLLGFATASAVSVPTGSAVTSAVTTTGSDSVPTTEISTVTFGGTAATDTALTAGQSVTIAGLTFTATATVSRKELLRAFINLADGATGINSTSAAEGAGAAQVTAATVTAKGYYSGALTGFTTTAADRADITAAATLVFTSSTASNNVADLVLTQNARAAIATAGTNIAVGKDLSSLSNTNKTLTMSGTINGLATTQSLAVSDNAALATQTFNFTSFGAQFDIKSYQAQTASQIGTAIGTLNGLGGTASFGNPGQLIVAQGNNSALKFQSGANSDAFIQVDTLNVQTASSGAYAGTASEMMTLGTRISQSGTGNLGTLGSLDTIDTWQTAFKNAAAAVDNALEYVSTQRSVYGSQMNRLSYVSTNLQAQSTNIQNSRSAIIDTDFAAETARLTKGQIMQQAATAMLAQANQMPNVILSLLK
jgi:flagellin